MIIKIDVRETALLQQIYNQVSLVPVFKSIEVKTETLPIGDIIINDGNEDKLIIERKSVTDLLSSIKDGRYEEQSYRLNGLDHHNHNIIYLIEGDINRVNRFKDNNHVEKLTMYSAMFSLNYYKGFSVFRSFSLDETANIVCNMAYKIGKDVTKPSYYQNKVKLESQNIIINESGDIDTTNILDENQDSGQDYGQLSSKDYINVVKKVKKENITPDNIGELMLCQIPGISSVTALAVMNRFKTIPNLLKELEANQESLKDLSYTNTKGQVRKINKTSIVNIVKFLLKK
jgi:crossover junction endonuclease MUS81